MTAKGMAYWSSANSIP